MTIEGYQTRFDKLLAWISGVSVAALAYISGNWLEFPPELWDKIAVAAKLRPPAEEFPMLWQICLSFFIDAFDISFCIDCLKLAGPISLGLLATISYRLFSGYLPKIMKGDMNYSRWGRTIVRITIFLGVLILVCSEPIWLAGRVLSPEISAFLLTSFILLLALFAVEKSSALCLITVGALSGVLAAENPFAFFIPVALRYYLGFKYRMINDNDLPELANPLVFTVAMRRMAFAFILCWTGVVALNLSFYCANGGGGETDANMFVAIVKYLLNYFEFLKNAMTPMGWFLSFVVVVFPLVVVTFKLRDLTDVRKMLPIPSVCFLSVAGTLALLQSAGFQSFHFWKWETSAVGDKYLLCLCMLGSSILAMNSIAIFAVDIFYRNYSRLLREIFVYEVEDEPVAVKVLKTFKTSLKFMRIPSHLFPVVVLAIIIPFKFDGAVLEMSSIVNEIACSTAEECGDAPTLFSDGSYDAAVEVAAAKHGKKLKAMSLMSGADEYDVAIRLRGETNEENISLLKTGAAEALRTWVHGKFACVSNIAIQIGFELWQQNKLPMPEIGGFVARTAGFPKGESLIRSAYDIADRILRFYEKYDLEKCGYLELNKLFLFGQWRIARMCRMRASAADRAKDWKLSEKESVLADKLDKLNPEWRKVQEKMTWIGKNSSMHLTPREGLKLGLDRADFHMAGSYAKRVLATDPDDMNANFALGMGFFTEKLYEKAEIHLKKCLIRAPDEPAVLNNLAVVQLRLGKLDEAETNAVRALKRFPASHEIKATLRHVKEARKELK